MASRGEHGKIQKHFDGPSSASHSLLLPSRPFHLLISFLGQVPFNFSRLRLETKSPEQLIH
jgi:hypothetical protein